ncbi:enoyl-CoA hydratase-related protein [Aeromicrobium sp. PE09-221]|uniref:enoyl-CoA hydratase/isomerase family protein n=1 Tax=Aeromicrobium sp. PE09-221 TaxID=1898043 RepID=UPI001481FF8A|nr:enoyl-CoA hydratase-related protein [Aeromicrobium sp. PE09-221]
MTSPYDTIRCEPGEGGVTVLTLNRPEKKNAYTWQMCQELCTALADFMADDVQRVLVLTGAGQAFCAGGDVESDPDRYWEGASGRELGHGMAMRESMHAVVRALHRVDKPTIAMIDGPAVSGGLTLALLCDVRIASEQARLGDASLRFALLPDEGGAWLFSRFMRPDLALRMVLESQIYDADTACELGLVTQVVPRRELVDTVMAMATAMAVAAPLASRLAKRMMRFAERASLDETLSFTELAVTIGNESPDVREGVAAFLERRPARFDPGPPS